MPLNKTHKKKSVLDIVQNIYIKLKYPIHKHV